MKPIGSTILSTNMTHTFVVALISICIMLALISSPARTAQHPHEANHDAHAGHDHDHRPGRR